MNDHPFYYILFESVLQLFTVFFPYEFFLTCNFHNQKFLLKPVPSGYGPISPRWHFQHLWRNLLSLLNRVAFYPLSTWPQDIQQLVWKNSIGDIVFTCAYACACVNALVKTSLKSAIIVFKTHLKAHRLCKDEVVFTFRKHP